MINEVKDYLLKFADDAEALTAAQQWIVIVEGAPKLKTPTWQSAMKVTGYSDLGVQATFDTGAGGVLDAGTPPIIHSSVWWVLTLPENEALPESLVPFVVTSGLRSVGLSLPAELAGFQSMIAGVNLV